MSAAYTVDDIICETSLLNQLLAVATDLLSDMDYGTGATRNVKLDRVNALVIVVSDSLERLISNVEASHGSLIEGEKKPVRMTGGDRNG